MGVAAKTICVNCRHHSGALPTRPWHEHRCLHPELERQKEQDPVTGMWVYSDKNDLGRIVLVEEKHPDCRDINHGNCQYFEKKK